MRMHAFRRHRIAPVSVEKLRRGRTVGEREPVVGRLLLSGHICIRPAIGSFQHGAHLRDARRVLVPFRPERVEHQFCCGVAT